MPQSREIVKIGNRYGKLVVVNQMRTQSENGHIYWRCKCDCGKKTIVKDDSLRYGLTKSCGCYIRECISKAKKKDETGNRYGKLVVLDEAPVRLNKHVCWRCRCDCGNEKIVIGNQLRQGIIKDCGCQGRYAARKKNEVGNRYGKLVVVSEARTRLNNQICWLCRCDCGNKKIIRGNALRRGVTKSCGCCQRKTVSRMMTKSKVGNRYGKLLVVGESPNRYWGTLGRFFPVTRRSFSVGSPYLIKPSTGRALPAILLARKAPAPLPVALALAAEAVAFARSSLFRHLFIFVKYSVYSLVDGRFILGGQRFNKIQH